MSRYLVLTYDDSQVDGTSFESLKDAVQAVKEEYLLLEPQAIEMDFEDDMFEVVDLSEPLMVWSYGDRRSVHAKIKVVK